ncbi:MAG: tetratricopeptide repeat protein [Acidobacteriaceae bacterium]
MLRLNRVFLSRHRSIGLAATALLTASLVLTSNGVAQSSSSSSSSSNPDAPAIDSTSAPRRLAQPNAGGSAITLETSEPLFFLAVALNSCGYDTDLANSSPVRQRVRDELNDELAGNADARDTRDALCAYVREHALNDPGRDLARYVSLALYLGPPPALATTVDEGDLPAEASEVVAILPLVRSFADAIHLNALWFEHRPEYDGFVDQIHDPLTKMVLGTDLYLHLPVSSYDGRRFMVLLEPMLAPSQTNARISDNDFIVVVSPAKAPAAVVPMDLIRHTYLHYVIEPLVNGHTMALNRLLPLLKPVQQSALDYTYKSDIVALVTECLIKAVELRMEDTGVAMPAKPGNLNERTGMERYEDEMAVYDRQSEAVRRRGVDLDMRQGWVLVDYFYGQIGEMEKDSTSLRDFIGPMVYGMDVDREQHHDEQIAFVPESSGSDIVKRTARPLTSLEVAELKLMKKDVDGAAQIAEAALKADPANADAHYLLGRIDLMQGDPDGALEHLDQTIQLSHDPRTVAWAHIYLGRMYDIAQTPEREKALAEYHAALANRDSQPDTKAAAEKGIKEPFALPQRAAAASDQQQGSPGDMDPTGKAAKEAYRPTPPQ